MKNKFKKNISGEVEKLLETKLSSRTLYKRNKYLLDTRGPFLKWTRDELRQMDQRTRKLMTITLGIASQRRR